MTWSIRAATTPTVKSTLLYPYSSYLRIHLTPSGPSSHSKIASESNSWQICIGRTQLDSTTNRHTVCTNCHTHDIYNSTPPSLQKIEWSGFYSLTQCHVEYTERRHYGPSKEILVDNYSDFFEERSPEDHLREFSAVTVLRPLHADFLVLHTV